jgi:PAS domain S-box-containing protein
MGNLLSEKQPVNNLAIPPNNFAISLDTISNLKAVFENADLGIICARRDKSIAYINNAAIRLLTLSEQNIDLLNLDEIISYRMSSKPLLIDDRGAVIFEYKDSLTLISRDNQPSRCTVGTSNLVNSENTAEGTLFYIYDNISCDFKDQDKPYDLQNEIFEAMGIGFSLISPELEVLYLNQKMKSWFPATECASRPKCYKSFNNPPRENICVYCPVIKALADGKTHNSITSTPSPGGTVNFNLIAAPIIDSNGKIKAVIELVEDVTEKHQYENFIKGRIEYLSALVGLTGSREIARTTFDHIKKLTSCDSGSIVIFKDNAINLDSLELIYSFDEVGDEPKKESTKTIKNVAIASQSHTVDVISKGTKKIIHRTENELSQIHLEADPDLNYSPKPSVSLAYIPLKIHGNTIGVLSVQSYSINAYDDKAVSLLEIVAADLSMALIAARTSEISKLNEERWRSYVENAPYGVFIADAKGNYLRVNSEACRITGYSETELLAMSIPDLLTPESQDAGKNSFIEVAKTGKTFVEVGFRAKSGAERNWSIAAVKVSDDELIGFAMDISDRKKAEDELYQSRQLLQIVIDSIPAGVFWKGRDLVYLGCNQKAADDAGMESKPAIIGKTDFDLAWRVLAESYRADDELVMKSGVPKLNYEEKLIDPNGKEGWVLTNKIPIRDQGGSVFGLVGTYEDITERKLAHKKIQLDNLRMDALLSIHRMGSRSPDEIISTVVEDAISVTESKIGYLATVDEDESILTMRYWSKTAHESCGVIDKPIIYKIEDTGLWGEAIRQRKPVITNDYSIPSQLKRGLPAGHVPILRHLNIPVFAGEKIVAVVGVGNKEADYTDDDVRQLQLFMDGWWQIMKRKEAEIELKASKDLLIQTISQYTAMLNTVPALMYVKNLEQKYTVINDAFAAFVGLPHDQIIGKTAHEILPPDVAEILHKGDQVVFETDTEIINREAQMKNSDGATRWLSITMVPLHGFYETVIGLVGFAQDVTEYRQSRQQLIQSDKLAAIGTLAAGVAHEINNPIGYVSSNLNTMGKYLKRIGKYLEDGSPADERESLKEILTDFEDAIKESIEGSGRVRKIVADLKSFSRVDRTERELADINDGIKSTLNIVWNELKYKCQVEQDLGDIPDLFCIPNQLNQVFMNILVNAGQAIDKAPGIIKIKTWADTENIYVSIKDNGVGIKKEIKDKVFEPFFTTKDVGKGTGLGLSLSYDIIKKHNGTIEINSESGAGTEFVITLPLEGLSES